LPYGRQDKQINNGSTFALSVFCHLLKTLQIDRIEIVDPHSRYAMESVPNAVAVYHAEKIYITKGACGADIFAYPDDGAKKKYSSILVGDFVYGEKKREQLSGDITEYKITGNVKDKSVLIESKGSWYYLSRLTAGNIEILHSRFLKVKLSKIMNAKFFCTNSNISNNHNKTSKRRGMSSRLLQKVLKRICNRKWVSLL